MKKLWSILCAVTLTVPASVAAVSAYKETPTTVSDHIQNYLDSIKDDKSSYLSSNSNMSIGAVAMVASMPLQSTDAWAGSYEDGITFAVNDGGDVYAITRNVSGALASKQIIKNSGSLIDHAGVLYTEGTKLQFLSKTTGTFWSLDINDYLAKNNGEFSTVLEVTDSGLNGIGGESASSVSDKLGGPEAFVVNKKQGLFFSKGSTAKGTIFGTIDSSGKLNGYPAGPAEILKGIKQITGIVKVGETAAYIVADNQLFKISIKGTEYTITPTIISDKASNIAIGTGTNGENIFINGENAYVMGSEGFATISTDNKLTISDEAWAKTPALTLKNGANAINVGTINGQEQTIITGSKGIVIASGSLISAQDVKIISDKATGPSVAVVNNQIISTNGSNLNITGKTFDGNGIEPNMVLWDGKTGAKPTSKDEWMKLLVAKLLQSGLKDLPYRELKQAIPDIDFSKLDGASATNSKELEFTIKKGGFIAKDIKITVSAGFDNVTGIITEAINKLTAVDASGLNVESTMNDFAALLKAELKKDKTLSDAGINVDNINLSLSLKDGDHVVNGNNTFNVSFKYDGKSGSGTATVTGVKGTTLRISGVPDKLYADKSVTLSVENWGVLSKGTGDITVTGTFAADGESKPSDTDENQKPETFSYILKADGTVEADKKDDNFSVSWDQNSGKITIKNKSQTKGDLSLAFTVQNSNYAAAPDKTVTVKFAGKAPFPLWLLILLIILGLILLALLIWLLVWLIKDKIIPAMKNSAFKGKGGKTFNYRDRTPQITADKQAVRKTNATPVAVMKKDRGIQRSGLFEREIDVQQQKFKDPSYNKNFSTPTSKYALDDSDDGIINNWETADEQSKTDASKKPRINDAKKKEAEKRNDSAKKALDQKRKTVKSSPKKEDAKTTEEEVVDKILDAEEEA